jgi:multidrug efflux pump subunit AcrA (membrane-fusion protein)
MIESALPMGASASVDVTSGRAENVVLIPVDALHEASPGQYTVFVMENGKPRLRVVEAGLKDLINAEIKSGIQVGDIVTTGITAVQ